MIKIKNNKGKREDWGTKEVAIRNAKLVGKD